MMRVDSVILRSVDGLTLSCRCRDFEESVVGVTLRSVDGVTLRSCGWRDFERKSVDGVTLRNVDGVTLRVVDGMKLRRSVDDETLRNGAD